MECKLIGEMSRQTRVFVENIAKPTEAMSAAVGYGLAFGLRRCPQEKGDGRSAREVKRRIAKRKGNRHEWL